MMSTLLLHNGNSLIKIWASKFYNCQPMPCLVDEWPNITEFDKKCAVADKNCICTDLTSADHIDNKDMFLAKKYFKTIKVITDYKHDCENLEPVWQNGYPQEQWLRSIFCRLSFADNLVFHQPVELSSDTTFPPIVFTPGRCGTHVIKDITGITTHLHHKDHNFILDTQFQQLLRAKFLVSVLRKQFAKQVISDAIGYRYGIINTTQKTFDQNVKFVSQWPVFEITPKDYEFSLAKICSYTDLLLGLSIFYNKKIQFSLFEDLNHHFAKIQTLKNPYEPENIISNYDEAVAICDQQYQSWYEQIINRIESITGTHSYIYD